MSRYVVFLLYIFFLILSPIRTIAGDIILYSINSDNYPNIKANLLISDDGGIPIKPTIQELKLTEFGLERTIKSIECDETQVTQDISVLIVIDLSNSMEGFSFSQAIRSAESIIDKLPIGHFECAITGFRDYSFLINDFTQDKELLKRKLKNQIVIGGTDFNSAFLSPTTGAFDVMKKSKYRKVLFFLTDGYGFGNEKLIIQNALLNNIAVHSVTYTLSTHPILKKLSNTTGGIYFENILTKTEAQKAIDQVVDVALEVSNCRVEWVSSDCIEYVEGDIQYLPLQIDDRFSYTTNVLSSGSPRIDITPSNIIDFGSVPPGSSRIMDFTIGSKNSDLEILDVVSDYSEFEIIDWNGNPPPFLIEKDKFRRLMIKYSPIDSGIVKSRIMIKTNACLGNEIYAIGGYPGIVSKRTSIKVVHPNGFEVFIAGSDTLIKWSNTTPNDIVQLEFSDDGGVTWSSVNSLAKGYKEKWEVPNIASEKCLIRASESNTGADEIKKFKIFNSPVQKVIVNDQNEKILGFDRNGAIILFDMAKMVTQHLINKSGKLISDIDWSYDNSTYAYSEEEVAIYNSASGTQISKFRDINDLKRYYNVALNDDGSKYITNIAKNEIVIVDSPISTPADTLILYTDASAFFDFINQTDFIALSTSGDVSIYSLSLSKEINKFKIPQSFVFRADYDRASNRLGVLDMLNNVYVVNTNGEKISDFKLNTTESSSISLSPNGNSIAIGTNDGWLLLYNSLTGEEIQRIRISNEKINSVDWSKIGTHIYLACEDKYIYSYEVTSKSNNDISDNLFSIVRPEIEAYDIDMGLVEVGELKDSSLIDYITNNTLFSIEIDSISIKDSDNFKAIAGYPKIISSKNKSSAGFAFSPKTIGLIESTINLHIGTITKHYKIRGVGYQNDFDLDSKIVDLGKIMIGKYKDSIITPIRLFNITHIKIDSIRIIGPDLIQFRADVPPDEQLLNESFAMPVKFECSELGVSNTIVSFYYDSPSSPSHLLIIAEGVDSLPEPTNNITISVGNYEVYIGDKLNIPVIFEFDEKLIPNNIQVSGELTINATVLSPINEQSIGTINNGIRRIPFSSVISKDFLEFNFVATLGNSDSSILSIEKVNISDARISHRVKNGNLKILDICREGGDRLIYGTDDFGIVSIEEFEEDYITIKVNTIENGDHKLQIFNALGNLAKSIYFNNDNGNTSQFIKIHKTELTTGIYFIFINSLSLIDCKRFPVVK